jgi:6-phosphogluconate dehydrogenase
MQLGVIGLGTMGANLARNAARNGAKVAVFNRTTETMEKFVKDYGKEGDFVACKTTKDLVKALEAPRAILLMVKAGDAVDAVVNELLPLLSKGDILIDGGNSHYRDTERRTAELEKKGIQFLGMGVSGGEEGALHGPSMMPGGSKKAWDEVSPLFTKMAADDGEGGKCVTFNGLGGAGHFVKMVHNGIEYGVMQLLAECYHLLKEEEGMDAPQLARVFGEWNESDELKSFLLEITAKIFTVKDPEGKGYLVDSILDKAGQKGTGKWTTNAALDYGVSIPTITAAVDARIVSSGKDFRVQHGKSIDLHPMEREKGSIVDDVRGAFELSMLNTYAQGFQLLFVASEAEKWNLPVAKIVRTWQGGCIIRSEVLKLYSRSFSGDKKASESIRARFTKERMHAWRRIVALGALRSIPLPAMSSALIYADAYRHEWLPQNLTNAQRDFFGAHTFERTDKKGIFHADWQ